MVKEKFSKHMTRDRADRYVLIATKVGFGEVLYTRQRVASNGHEVIMELTSTGVIIVRGLDRTIVTMYCTTLACAKLYFELDRLPKNLLSAINRNQRNGYCMVK